MSFFRKPRNFIQTPTMAFTVVSCNKLLVLLKNVENKWVVDYHQYMIERSGRPIEHTWTSMTWILAC